jgi:membrane associated rhomboid family serine protease
MSLLVSAGVCCLQVGYKIAAGEYWRLLTAAFVHGNVLHVGVRVFQCCALGRGPMTVRTCVQVAIS